MVGGGGAVNNVTGISYAGANGGNGVDLADGVHGGGGGGGAAGCPTPSAGFALAGNGGLYGGGGSGAPHDNVTNGIGGDGANGIIVITYSVVTPTFTQSPLIQVRKSGFTY
jgi:hypothetical protein